MTSVKALATPSVLQWARITASMDVQTAASKASVKPQQIADWESGNEQPTLAQLRKLCDVYKRPIAVFYLPSPPEPTRNPPNDFRRLSAGVSAKYSSELAFEIRRANYRRTVAQELYVDLNDGTPAPQFDFAVRSDMDPEEVGVRLRNFLEVDLLAQKSWADSYESWNGWRSATERKYVLVFQCSGVSIEEMRGFSISAQPLPVVVVNIKDKPVARVFTLLHELTHIALDADGICNLTEDSKAVEVFCNAVAGAALVPAATLMKEAEVRQTSSGDWSEFDIEALANRYRVSRLVIIRRLFKLDLMSKHQFESFHVLFSSQYKKELDDQRDDKKPIQIPQHTLAISKAGTLFSRLVLFGYKQEKITGVDFTDWLSLKLKYLPAFETSLLSK